MVLEVPGSKKSIVAVLIPLAVHFMFAVMYRSERNVPSPEACVIGNDLLLSPAFENAIHLAQNPIRILQMFQHVLRINDIKELIREGNRLVLNITLDNFLPMGIAFYEMSPKVRITHLTLRIRVTHPPNSDI